MYSLNRYLLSLVTIWQGDRHGGFWDEWDRLGLCPPGAYGLKKTQWASCWKGDEFWERTIFSKSFIHSVKEARGCKTGGTNHVWRVSEEHVGIGWVTAGEENRFTRKEPVAQKPLRWESSHVWGITTGQYGWAMKVKERHFTCGQRGRQSGHGRVWELWQGCWTLSGNANKTEGF